MSPLGEPGAPVSPGERILALDFVRGVAVLGMLLANIIAFSHPFLAYTWPGALPGGAEGANGWLWLAQFVLVDGKFRGLFTILFGAGLVLLHERGASGGLQARRLALLLAFGLAHFTFLFAGDILVTYALAGFAGLMMLEMSGRRQVLLGLVWYVIATLLLMLMLVEPVAIEQFAPAGEAQRALGARWNARLAETAAERAAFSHGSYGEVIAFRLMHQLHRVTQAPFLALIETIPLMLVGMGLYRCGLFNGGITAGRLRRWGWAALALGLAGSLALGAFAIARGFDPFLTEFLFNAPAALPALLATLGLAALLVAWCPRASEGRLGRRIAAAGRMAFSNYIGTSLIMMLVFHGWAGGLFGQFGRAELLVFVALGWMLILAWSKPWLDHFRYGPLEWLWRCATYGERFAMRR